LAKALPPGFPRGNFSIARRITVVNLKARLLFRTAPVSDSLKPASQTDEQLMLAFSHGDTTAFDGLFSRYHQRIFAFLRRRIADQSRAEELTQETFLALIRAAFRYQPRALFRTYIYAIAFKILRDDRRKMAFRSFFLGPNEKSDLAPAAPESNDEILWLRQALGRLDSTDREILLLREFEQLSYLEIADLLKLPLNTVRSRLFRARLALRERLEPAASANAVLLGELS
jgi:RNA polymerase sigma-70 factor, ECF subfamily